VYAGATPHTRGSTLLCKCILKSCTGYPAHAGIDRILYLVQTKLFGLPRTRGDRPLPQHLYARQVVATPHTRGSTHAAA
jgi:hypothetical protein